MRDLPIAWTILLPRQLTPAAAGRPAPLARLLVTIALALVASVVLAQPASARRSTHSLHVSALALGSDVRVSGSVPHSVARRARSGWRIVLEQRVRSHGHRSWRNRALARLNRRRNGAFLLRWHRRASRRSSQAAGLRLAVRVVVIAGRTLAARSATTAVRSAGAPLRPRSCPTAKVIGVRGSGETAHDYGGYGRTVRSVVDGVLRLEPGSDAEYVNYDAIGVQWWDKNYYSYRYNQSVGTGISSLLRHLSGFLQTCHDSRVYLVGHSQGAQVVADTYLGWISDAERARVTGVALTGDPKFKGGQEGPAPVGSFDRGLNGIAARLSSNVHVWPRSDWGKVRSYCIGGDLVCSFSPVTAAACGLFKDRCPHTHYPDLKVDQDSTYTLHAAKFLVGIPSPPKSSPLPPKGGTSPPSAYPPAGSPSPPPPAPGPGPGCTGAMGPTGPIRAGFHIGDVYYGGTWARTDPCDGTWHAKGNPPANGAYWYPNGLGVGVDCARTGAAYVVRFTNGHSETWNTWFHVTDGKWFPSAAASETTNNGYYGLPAC